MNNGPIEIPPPPADVPLPAYLQNLPDLQQHSRAQPFEFYKDQVCYVAWYDLMDNHYGDMPTYNIQPKSAFLAHQLHHERVVVAHSGALLQYGVNGVPVGDFDNPQKALWTAMQQSLHTLPDYLQNLPDLQQHSRAQPFEFYKDQVCYVAWHDLMDNYYGDMPTYNIQPKSTFLAYQLHHERVVVAHSGALLQYGVNGVRVEDFGNPQKALWTAMQQALHALPEVVAPPEAPLVNNVIIDEVDLNALAILQEDLTKVQTYITQHGNQPILLGQPPHQKSYRVWFNQSTQAFNIQLTKEYNSSTQKEKIGIRLGANGKPLSIYAEGKKINNLQSTPVKYLKLLHQLHDLVGVNDNQVPVAAPSLDAQQFAPSDWILFSTLLEKNGGKNKNRHNANEGFTITIPEDGQNITFRACLEEKDGGLIITLQPDTDFNNQSWNNKLGVRINEQGWVMSIQIDGPNPISSVPQKWVDRMNLIFKNNLLEGSSEYTTFQQPHSGTRYISAEVLPRSLLLYPLWHLQMIQQKMKEFAYGIRVNFFSDTLKKGPGIDAGGLSNEYFDSLTQSLYKNGELSMVELSPKKNLPQSKEAMSDDISAHRPELSPEEGLHYQNLGYVMNGCYVRKQMMGHHFSPALFHAVFYLANHPNLTDSHMQLPIFTQLETCRVLLNAIEEDSGQSQHVFTKNISQYLELEARPEDNWWDIEYQGVTPKSLIEEELIYKDYFPADLFDENDEPNLLLIEQNGKGKFQELLLNHIFRYNDSGRQLSRLIGPIFHMAKGIKKYRKDHQNLMNNVQPTKFHQTIQGFMIDREKIANGVEKASLANNEVTQLKMQWLKEMIRELQPDQLEILLKYISGKSNLGMKDGKEEVIKVNFYSDLNGAYAGAHTCFTDLDLLNAWLPDEVHASPEEKKAKFCEKLMNTAIGSTGFNAA